MYPFNGYENLNENDVEKLKSDADINASQPAFRSIRSGAAGQNPGRSINDLVPGSSGSGSQGGSYQGGGRPGGGRPGGGSQGGSRPSGGSQGGSRPGGGSQGGGQGNFPESSPQGKPSSPPPSRIPERSPVALYKIDSGAIRGTLFHFTYLWLKNGVSFWFYPVYIGKNSMSGYRWTRFGWAFAGIDLSWVEYFETAPGGGIGATKA
ncbi:MAG: hypothetical protein LBU32_04415 [Clostridiales bacterium]|jgi:hypothetical protein|nr:hypothetical protein [Clostridiales bacterium]